MATVRFSGELRDQIIGKATATFADRLRKAANTDTIATEWTKKIYDRAMSQYQEHIKALPVEFFNFGDNITITCKVPIEVTVNGETKHYRYDLKFEGNLGARYMLPASLPPELGISKSWQGWEVNLNNPLWQDFRVAAVEWATNWHDLQQQKDKFVESVRRLITAHVTLAPALKVWPPLWDLVPEHYKAKHREVVERKKSEVIADDLGIDLNSMTATVVAHKIQGGK